NTVQQQRIPVFRRDRHDIEAFAITGDGRQIGRRRDVPIPKVVGNFLKMPEAPARPCVQRNEAICEQIVTQVTDTDEVWLGSAGRDVGNTAHFIERHSTPTVRGIVFGAIPRFISELAWMRHSVKCPQMFAGTDVKTPDVLFESRYDNNVLENGRAGSRRAETALNTAWQKCMPVFAESANRLAIGRI